MNFKQWLNEGDILAHIAVASGSGKTTLANKLSVIHPNIIFKDLDDFDDQAERQLGWSKISKKNFTDEMLLQLAKRRQQLMDVFIGKSNKQMVFVGHHTEGDHVLYIPTKNRFLLDVDADTSARRGYERSQKEDPNHPRMTRRTLSELPQDRKEAQETIDWLLNNNYKPMSHEQILQWMNDFR